MKKRIVSWLMTLVMVLGLVPTQVWADVTYDTTEDTIPQVSAFSLDEDVAPLALTASAVKEISTAEEFATMDPSGNYKLTKDITITAPYGLMFKGTFDGGGNTITLTFDVTGNDNYGLFKLVSGATIQNVALEVNIEASINSVSYGVGGLIGKVTNSKTTVENCAVSGTIKNTSTGSNGSYVGGLVGYISADFVVKNCYSTAKIINNNKGTASKTGGIIGGLSSSAYSVTAENCYCSGDVTAAKGYAGGFIGYLNSSGTKPHTYKNCFAAGIVSGATENCGFAYAYKGYSAVAFTFENCYANSANTTAQNITSTGSVEKKNVDELKQIPLGSEFITVAGDYPILRWQQVDPNATYTVTLDVEPKNSVLTWNGAAQTVRENGQYTFSVKVSDCPISYTVSNEAGDYAPKSGTVSVKNKDVSVPVELELNKHKLTFTGLPDDATLTVKKGTTVISPDTYNGRTYTVTKGDYTYSVTAFGYKSIENQSLTVGAADKTETVTMQAAEGTLVTFAYSDNTASVANAKITVKTTKGYSTITMTAVEGSDGMQFKLPFDYKYTWTFTSGNYIDQSGNIRR